MLQLFRSAYYLKDIIPDKYVDIHNHILPGIDDGARNLEECSKLVSGMKKLNISCAIATPHTYARFWDNTPQIIKKACQEAGKVDLNRIFIKGCASEYMLDASLMERIRREELLCIKDNYLLVELPLSGCPLNLFEMLFELQCSGYEAIIAHPERYLYFHKDIGKVKRLKELGFYFQLNLMALTGNYGKRVQKFAEHLIDHDFYDFTGTDVHNQKHIEQLLHRKIRFNKKKMESLLLKNGIFHE